MTTIFLCDLHDSYVLLNDKTNARLQNQNKKGNGNEEGKEKGQFSEGKCTTEKKSYHQTFYIASAVIRVPR